MTSIYLKLRKIIRRLSAKKKRTICFLLKFSDFEVGNFQNELTKDFNFLYHNGELITEMMYVLNQSDEFGYWNAEKVKTKINRTLISHGSIVVFFKNLPIAVSSLCLLDNADQYPTLMYLVVNKKFRGKGIGIFLLLEMIKKSQEHGYKGIKLKTETDRRNALYLYEKLGFKQIDCK